MQVLFFFLLIFVLIIYFYQMLKTKELLFGYTTIKSENGIEKLYTGKANVKIYHWGENRSNSRHNRNLSLSTPNWGVYGIINVEDERLLKVFNNLFDDIEEDREQNSYYLIVKKYGILIDSEDFQKFLSKLDTAIMNV